MNRHWREKRQCLSPAFFFVLEKAVKSVGTAVIPTSLTRWSHEPRRLWHERLIFAFADEMGTHSALLKESHTAAYTAKQGAFRMGALLLPSERFTRFGNPAWSGNFAAFEPWSRALSKNAESLGTAMRSCVSLFRGVAAPLGCVIFFTSVEIAACMPCAQGLSVCARRGVISLPSARFTCC